MLNHFFVDKYKFFYIQSYYGIVSGYSDRVKGEYMNKLIKGVLCLCMCFCMFLTNADIVDVQATQGMIGAYASNQTTSIQNGEGFIDASADVEGLKDLTSFTMHTTFTVTGSSVNSLFFIGDQDAFSNYVTIYINGTTLGIEARDESGSHMVSSTTTSLAGIDLTQPHKLSVVFEGGSTLKYYIDGELHDTKSVSSNFTSGFMDNADFVGFGKGMRGNGGNGYPLTGTLAQIEVFNYALNEEEVMEYHVPSEGVLYRHDGSYYEGINADLINDYDNVATLSALSQGSTTIRFKSNDSQQGEKALMAINNDEGEYSGILINPSLNTIAFDATVVDLNTTDVSIQDMMWHTLSITKNHDTFKFYLDGELIESISDAEFGYYDRVANSTNISIGHVAGSENHTFIGAIDNIVVYDIGYSEFDILAEHSATLWEAGLEPDLSNAYFKEAEAMFYSGYDDSNSYRIPSLLTTKEGTVLAAIDKRITGSADAGNIDISIRRREAGETTFSDPHVVVDLVDSNNSTPSAFLIDAAMVQDEETGRILMIYDMFPESVGLMNSDILETGSGYTEIEGKQYQVLLNDAGEEYTVREDGVVYTPQGDVSEYVMITQCAAPYDELGNLYKNGEYVGNAYLYSGSNAGELSVIRTHYLWISYSDDDGVTWSNPIDITPQVKEDWMKFIGDGPGVGIQLESGELLFPVYSASANVGGSQSSAVILSADGGETWTLGESPNILLGADRETMNDSSKMVTEAQLIQLNNGEVKMFMRNTSGKVRVATSSDKGMTWDSIETIDEINDVYCQMSVFHYNNNGKEYVVLSNPKYTGRMDGFVYLGEVTPGSSDITWTHSQQLYEGHFQYSCITDLGVNAQGVQQFGILYEVDDAQGQLLIEYAEFDQNWITADLVEQQMEAPKVISYDTNIEGDTLQVTMHLDQSVFVRGEVALQMQIANQNFNAVYVSGSGSNAVKFEVGLPANVQGVVKTTSLDIGAGYIENMSAMKPVIESTTILDLTKISNTTIASYSSQHSSSAQEGTDGAASNVIDGNPNTYWHSTWGGSETLPQHVVIDLQESTSIYKFAYTPRQNASSGRVMEYELQVSEDGVNYTSFMEGSFSTSASTQSVEFIPLQARYVKFVVHSSTAGASCSVAELEVFEYTDGIYEIADKTELEKVLNSIQSLDLDIYSEASVDALEETMQFAQVTMDATTPSQSMVDHAYAEMIEAKNQLIYVEEAKNLYDTYKQYEASSYESGWEEFVQLLDEVVDMLAQATTNKEVSDAVVKMTYANSLLVISLDMEKEMAMDTLQSYVDLQLYAQAEEQQIVEILKQAESDIESASDVEEIEDIINTVKDAVDAIALKADYTEITQVLQTLEMLDENLYANYEVVQAAVDAVNYELNTTQQAQVTEMANAITQAIQMLEYKGADYSNVNTVITQANELFPSLYVNFEIVDTAIAAVQYDLDITKQSEVDAYVVAIKEAMNTLQMKPIIYDAIQVNDEKDPFTYRIANESIQNFDSVFVDGMKLDSSMFEVIDGSIIVSLLPTYLNALQDGEYTLWIVSATNVYETTMVYGVSEVPNDGAVEESVAPSTGDTSNTASYILLVLISFLLGIGVRFKIKQAK